MDTFRFSGEYWEDLGYKSKCYGTHRPCPHSGWTWKGHMWLKKCQNHWKQQRIQHPIKSLDEKCVFQNDTRTKMTALAISIDLKRDGINFHGKINSNRRIVWKIMFYHSLLLNSRLFCFGWAVLRHKSAETVGEISEDGHIFTKAGAWTPLLSRVAYEIRRAVQWVMGLLAIQWEK